MKVLVKQNDIIPTVSYLLQNPRWREDEALDGIPGAITTAKGTEEEEIGDGRDHHPRGENPRHQEESLAKSMYDRSLLNSEDYSIG